eukprot:c21013_g1_i1 orf=803-3535(+)
MAFACCATLGTPYFSSSAHGSAPFQRTRRFAQSNKPWIDQGKKLEQQGLELSKYDPLPSYYSLASELEGLCEMGQLDKAFDVLSHMDQLGFVPSNSLYWALLSTCKKKKSLHYASRVRLHMDSLVLDPKNYFLAEYLISALVSCHALDTALEVFHSLPHKTAYSWTALISGYVENGNALEAFKLYDLMLKEGIQPDEYTCVSLLKACTSTLNLEMGKAIHDYARENGYESNAFVGSTLVTMYGKCGSIADAEDVFGMMPYRSVVAWTTMLVGYVEHGQGMKALQLYRQMQEECLVVDEQTFAVALQACCILAEKEKGIVDVEGGLCKAMALEIGQALHADAWRKGYDSNVYVGNLLVCMYGKCGNILAAENVFFGFAQKNVALWNAMLSAYVDQSAPENTLRLYISMLEQGQSPEERSFVVALQACSLLAEEEEAVFVEESLVKAKSLRIGEALHTDAKKQNFDSNLYVSSALLNMYGKCGDLITANKVFEGLSQRSIVSWNAMLSAYVEQGQVNNALQLYQRMQSEEIGVDDVTLISLLQLSGQTGSIELCRQTYMDIVFGGFDLRPLVAFNLIYAFGKCANMVDAQAIFDALPLSNAVPWNALIAGYAQQGDCKASFYYFQRMQQVGLKPDGDTFLSLLAACSYAGLVKEGVGYFDSMSTEHGITPQVEHYVIMMNLLGYAGEFVKVEDMLSKLPMQPSLSLWLCILEFSVKHANVRLGKRAFNSAVRLQPKEAAAYLLMSNIYTDAGLQSLANQVEISRQKEGAHRKDELSWIEHKKSLLSFSARDRDDPKQQKYLWELSKQLKGKAEFLVLEYLLMDVASGKVELGRSLCGHSQLLALAFELCNPPARKLIRLRKNACICRDCHKLIKLISSLKHLSIVVIDDKRTHYVNRGKCSCRDYFYAPSNG